jgi:hypothetical protein
MTTKLFERLVTKFSIKVSDLIKYLEISKATIYNYRNLENFSDIPKDKQIKIFYLFGKETEEELETGSGRVRCRYFGSVCQSYFEHTER